MNRLVPAPAAIDDAGTIIRSLALPLAEDAERRWKRYPLFKAAVPAGRMSCHASVLSVGHSPHPPHVHDDEELLIPLDDECELILAEDAKGTGARALAIAPGAFVYYPAGQYHTIRNAGSRPASYLMFRWRGGAESGAEPMATQVVQYREALDRAAARPFATTRLFEDPTRWLAKLHAHTSVVRPGGGYAAHADAHDVALVLLEGRIDTCGQTVAPLSVVYHPAGQRHGLSAVGEAPARYLVFEFHGLGAGTNGLRPAWREWGSHLVRRLKALRWWRR